MFDPHLAVGQVLSETQIHDIFECQTTLGIRMSSKNNLIVLMSGSSKQEIYHDKWHGDILYYIGTDTNADENGNQTLIRGRGNNNAQLRDVWFEKEEDRKQLFLFVKKETNKCVYKGPVVLNQEPYMDWRDDSKQSKVWVYPLKLSCRNEDAFEFDFENAVYEASGLDIQELYKKAEGKSNDRQPENATKKYMCESAYYERNPDIAAYAKKRAVGICDLCGNPAPFEDKYGNPYLEAHHVDWLSNGGNDEINNVVALCPNCHRKMHIVDEQKDVDKLKDRLTFYCEWTQRMFKKEK